MGTNQEDIVEMAQVTFQEGAARCEGSDVSDDSVPQDIEDFVEVTQTILQERISKSKLEVDITVPQNLER